MSNRDKISLYSDRAITIFLSLLIFCLPFSKAMVEIFVWIATFIFILKKIIMRSYYPLRRMLPETELNMSLTLFIAVNALSLIFTSDYRLSLRGFFGKEIKFLAIYFMLVETINSNKRLKVVLIAIIASSILITVDAAAQYFRGLDFIRHYPFNLLRGPFATNNGFGGWLIIIIPLFLGLLAKNIIKGVALKILLSILITSLLLCLSATFSRGAWIGFIVAIFLTVLYIFKDFTPKVKLTFLAKGVSILLIFLILPQPLKNKIMTIGNIYYKTSASLNSRIKSIFKIGEGSIPVRFKLWKESLRIIGAYPLTGCGLNTYSKVAPEYKIFEGGGVYSHNSYLQKAAETGLLGLFSFFFVIFNFFKIGMRHFKRSKDYLLLGFLCGILAFLVHAFFDTHLYSLQLVVLFWFMLGLAVAVMKLGLNSG